MSLRASRLLRAGLLPSANTPAGITNRLLLTMGSPRENIFYLKPIDSVTVPGTEGTFTITNNHSLVISQLSPGVITVRDGTDLKDFFISDGFVFFNQPSDGTGCCRAEISGVELVPKEALDKDRAAQLLSEVQSAAKETEWDKVKAQLGTNLLNQVIKHAD